MPLNFESNPGIVSKIDRFLKAHHIHWGVLAALGVLEVGLIIGVLYIGLRMIGFPILIGGTAATPTPKCVNPRIIIGTTAYTIQPLERSADGSINLPNGRADTAYSINRSLIFGLLPAEQNRALAKSLKSGDLVSVTQADCTEASFFLAAPEVGASLPAQAGGGIIIFVPDSSAGQGFVIRGSPVPVQVVVTDTPNPNGPGKEAEISLLKVIPAKDQTTIQVSVSVHNTGAAAFTLNPNEAALALPNSAPAVPTASDPGLPHEIPAGATQTFTFTFPRPGAPGAVLNVLGVEMDVEGY